MQKIETKMNRYEDGYDSPEILVTDAGRYGKLVGIGVVAEGQTGNKRGHREPVPGPWAYSFGHAVVVDGAGTGASARERAIKLTLGEEFTIDHVPGVYRFVAGFSDTASPQLERVDEEVAA